MKARSGIVQSSFTRLSILVLGLVTAYCVPLLGQTQRDRFWVAGRYDGDRIVVYFKAVKLRGTIPPNAPKLARAVAEGFFDLVELPASYIAQFQQGPDAEHFAVGDKYDLLLGKDNTVEVTLTRLIGSETDEPVGNDSYIGALAAVKDKNDLLFSQGYYAVRRHQELQLGDRKTGSEPHTIYAHLLDDPVRFDIQSRIASLLNRSMKTIATDAERREAEKAPPIFELQSFRMSNGSLRYYARAEWRSEKKSRGKAGFVLAAWLMPAPKLQILAVENRTSSYDFHHSLPILRNVVDLGCGRTGLIVSFSREDSSALALVEYRDGVSLSHMRTLQTIGVGE